jgi:hypothetical protein
MQKQLTNIMQKEMTRKEFVTTLGFGLLSIFGFSTILNMVTGKSFGQTTHQMSNGYGSSSYGK